MGHGGALVETTPFDRRGVVSNPNLAAMYCRDLGQVLNLQLPVALRRVNTDTVSIAVVGSASERLIAVRSAIEMDKCNTIQYCS